GPGGIGWGGRPSLTCSWPCGLCSPVGTDRLRVARDFHVVFGAGPLGIAVVRALQARGLRTRLVTRGGRRAIGSAQPSEWVEADATDASSAQRACLGASVVYHCAGAPYQRWGEL